MEAHYSRCRFRIRQSIPPIPQQPGINCGKRTIPARVFRPQDQVKEIPLLKDYGVAIQAKANIPICTNSNCFNGILPQELVSHLKNHHKISLPSGSLDFLQLPHKPPQDIYQLDHPIPPFEGIWMYLGMVCKSLINVSGIKLVIENCIGLLKNRFQSLKGLQVSDQRDFNIINSLINLCVFTISISHQLKNDVDFDNT
ncbi:hypothetical protein VP01_2406g4 [Puccinia sorghi]|uniref:DDE Tnp4 domain-containing protein n=1 Tax=Puccinia sorghi TaxID=27349 RepID=A0A0L6V7D4_9BASI|nr:hypothetical protein VP01_2406g4 [Puccinia sorghi]